ncbi:MAG: substrate-binding domain-containing protein [Thermoproteus sp. AZ2]|jgi:molybdate/tungstate transport system substrate-binding protein|uniref:Substrate-binding domain-containing protein n=1 Tax=Thermoproteus sp. AZ2 TaxID=1609232 RepID=A0ACC6UZX2_9CREN
MRPALLAAISAVVIIVAALGLYLMQRAGPPAPSATNATPTNSLSLCIAGAYAVEGEYLKSAFFNATGIRVAVRPGGSFALAHEIALGTPCGVFMPVAFRQAVAGTGPYNPGWAIALAADEVVIVYSNTTTSYPGAAELIELYEEAVKSNDTRLWYAFFYNLTSGEYPLGVADPSTDPEGLYALLLLEAAGRLYAGNQSYFIDRMAAAHANVTRSSTFYYIVPLKEGQIAFVFSYKSYAVANGLSYLEPPPWLNFGSPQYADWYAQFSWVIPVNGVPTRINGTPVYLYITIPKGEGSGAALRFLLFALSHRQDLAKFGLYPLPKPMVFGNISALPDPLAQMLRNGTLIYGGPLT